MTITSKFLRDIRESAEADLPVHASDAAVEMPDSLEGKLGARKVKAELDGTKAGLVSKKVATEEWDEDEMKESAEADLPVHASDAAEEVPDTLGEETDEDDLMTELAKLGEELDSDEELSEEDEDKMVAESDDEELSEEDELKMSEEDEKEISEEEDAKLEEEEEEKLSEEEEKEVKEAADALTKDETLPESFKAKVSSIFEAAVKRTAKKRVIAHKKKLTESYNNKLASTKKQVSNTLVNKVDGYLDYVVEEWMKENKVAVETSLRSEITEKFISGLKNLFESHYIEVPAEKTNVISEQARKIKSLEKELNEELVKNVEIRKENIRLKKSSIIKKLTEGMTVSDAAKFAELCEGVSFDNSQAFGQKLKVIKETYFPKSPKSSGDIDASLLTEGGLAYEEPKTITEVDVYAQAISRMVKK